MPEVVYSLPEERDTEQAAVVVFEQQPGGDVRRPGIKNTHLIGTIWDEYETKKKTKI